MANESEKTLEALKTAIQMEIDGKQFYLKVSRESGNELGKELLRSLAGEEDIHRKKFEEIFENIRTEKSWLPVDFRPDRGKRLRTIFIRASDKTGSNLKALTTELEAVETARGMEVKSYDFYKRQSKKAMFTAEKDFYETIAAEEQGHQLILQDYYEYLTNPAGWFVKNERPSLEG
jgi:rubrerythrin